MSAHPFCTLRDFRTLRILTGVIFAVSALAGQPIYARAQDNSQNKDTSVTQNNKPNEDILAKHVSVDAEDATLTSVLTTLMKSAGANYTLDNSLRAVSITAHLHNLRLDITLDILLRSSTPAAIYRVEEGVYRFLLKPETPAPTPLETNPLDYDPNSSRGIKHIQVVRVNFIDAAEVARLLGGISLFTNGQTYGLIDPAKFDGRVGGSGTGGLGAGNNGANSGGGNVQGGTVPANFLDYLWIVNAGAGF